MPNNAIVKSIASFDELIEYTAQVIRKEADYVPVEFNAKTLIAPLRVDGDEWEKRIDVRHAHYILTLQDELDKLLNEVNPSIRDDERPLVKAEVTEGSSQLNPDFLDFAKCLVTNMTDTQTFIVAVLGICGAAGYFGYARYLDSVVRRAESNDKKDVEVAALEQHEETKRKMLEPLVNIADSDPAKYAHYERPVTKMVRMLEEDDQIAFVGEGYISAEEAQKNTKPRRSPVLAKTVSSCDGEYLLLSENYSLGELILYLEQDEVQIKAYTSVLDTDEQRKLAQTIAERKLQEELPFSLNLQLSVEYTAKGLKFGSVVGIGDPRPDREHKTLRELLKK